MLRKEISNEKMLLIAGGDLIASKVKDYVSDAKQFVDADESVKEIVLDMTQVNIIDSIGITFVIGLYKSVVSTGRVFKTVNKSRDIQKLFDLMKLNTLF